MAEKDMGIVSMERTSAEKKAAQEPMKAAMDAQKLYGSAEKAEGE